MSDEREDNVRRCTARTAAGARCRRNAEEGSTRCSQHAYKARGRPSKLTPELTDEVVWLILEGNYIEVACQAVGISKSTFHNWQRRGAEAMARAEEQVETTEDLAGDKLYNVLDPSEWVYVDFLHALKTAEAFAETELLRQARPGFPGWQAPMTILERRFGMRWRRRESVELEGELGITPVKVVKPDTEERRKRVAEILAGAGVVARPPSSSSSARKRSTTRKRKDPNG